MEYADLDHQSTLSADTGGILWHLHGRRGGLLYIHLCQGGQEVLSACNFAHSSRYVCRKTYFGHHFAADDQSRAYGLQAAQLYNAG